MGQKSYYEIKILDTLNDPQFGFVTADCEGTGQHSGIGVGDDAQGWGVDGSRRVKWQDGRKGSYLCEWHANDVLGLACDLNTRQIFVSVNGSYDSPNGLVFQLDENAAQQGLFAALSASKGRIEYNLGDSPFNYGPPWPADPPLLAKNSTLGIVLDCRRNCISFSIDSKPVGKSKIGASCNSKFHAAVIFQEGKNSCQVHIASAPILSFHQSHCDRVTKADVDKEVESLKTSLKESNPEAHNVLLQLLNDVTKSANGGKDLYEKESGAGTGFTVPASADQVNIQPAIGGEDGGEAPDKIKDDAGVGCKLYRELVAKMGEERACVEFFTMLDMFKKVSCGDTALQKFETQTQERADVIGSWKTSLKNDYTIYDNDTANGRRLLEHTRKKACFTQQETLATFFKTSTKERCLRTSLLAPMAPSSDPRKQIVTSGTMTPRIKAAFHEVLRCAIHIIESNAALLLDIVVEIVEAVGLETAFSPILKTIDFLETTLHVLHSTASEFQILEHDSNTCERVNSGALDSCSDLSGAHGCGDIRAKCVQATARAGAARQCFSRLEACPEKQIKPIDLLFVCHNSMHSELWLLEHRLYDADHADKVMAWLDRQCVESELMRIVEHMDDSTLQQSHGPRRFLAMLNTIEAACKVLPLTSTGGFMPTECNFQIEKKKLDRILSQQGAQNAVVIDVRKRMEEGCRRIQKRWNILGEEKHDRQKNEENGLELAAEERKGEAKKNSEGLTGGTDKTCRWEFRRAETRYWQTMTLLYLQELKAVHLDRQQRNSVQHNRRSVVRCLELLDDTGYQVAKLEHQITQEKVIAAEGTRQASAEMHLDDAADEWEARLLGMLSLRQSTCRLDRNCVVVGAGTGTSRDLPIGELASDRKELILCEPDQKLSAFVASFIARQSPNIVRVFVYDKSGKVSGMEAPIILVPGGGLAAHLSTNEDGEKLLDFSAKGLSVYGLRLLVEAARADEDLVEATIAGVNDLDLSEPNSTFSRDEYAMKALKRKTLVKDMRFQSNLFGLVASVESVNIIVNIINVSASTSLISLNLSSNQISAPGVGVLSRFLGQGGAAMLKNLDLSGNKFGDKGAQYISELLTSKHQELHLLELATNNIAWEGALHLAAGIASAACNVSVLNLADNSVGNQGMVALSAALAFNVSMQSVNFSANEIGDIGVEALAHKWTNGKGPLHSLTSLNLSENDITVLGAVKLFGVDFDKTAPKLERLVLSSNRIMHQGIEKIANLLPSCKILQSLCLETQKSFCEMSDLNTHQFFVKSEFSLEEACITELETRQYVFSDLRSSNMLKPNTAMGNTELSKAVHDYCASVQDSATQIKIENRMQEMCKKHLSMNQANMKETAKEEWEKDKSKKARSDAMKKLKNEWSRSGKPPSHLNRQDLSIQSKIALAELICNKNDMRAKEAVWYLNDDNYTTALTTSIEAKRVCVEKVRTDLFSSLLRPLRSRIEDEAHHCSYTDIAVKILDSEMRSSALHRILEFQRLLHKQREYQVLVEKARSSNCSASVTESFVEEVLTELPIYESTWSKKIRDEHLRELARRVLADVVQSTMRGPLSTLDHVAMESLKEEDSKRKILAMEKEAKAVGQPSECVFADAVTKLENFVRSISVAPQKRSLELTVTLIGDDDKTILRDLCHSNYRLTCTEKNADACSVGERGMIEDVVEAAATASSKTDVLVIDKGMLEPPEKRPASEEEVMYLFRTPDVKAVWASSASLSELWDVTSGAGTYAATYPQGSPTYWQEVGWLVSCVPLPELIALIAKVKMEQAALWATRWRDELCARDAVGRFEIEDGLARMKPFSFEEHADLISSKIKVLWGNHSSAVREAHGLCRDLSNMWDKDPRSPDGFIEQNFNSRIGGAKGRLAWFLEVHEMLKQVKGVMMDAATDESTKTKQLQAIVKEIRDFCSHDLPRLCPAYFDQTADALLRHPVRLARQRVAAVRQHVAGLFKTELKEAGITAERFNSPALRCLLTDTAQHIKDLACLEGLRKMLAFDTHLSNCCNVMSLPVLVAANTPVTGRLGLTWKDVGSQKPEGFMISNAKLTEALFKTLVFTQAQWDGFGVPNLTYNSYIEANTRFFKPAAAVSFLQQSHLNPAETKRTYSSVKNNDAPGQGYAQSCLDSAQAWSPASTTDAAWMEIDLGDMKAVAGVVTQGCASKHSLLGHQHVRTITVEHRGQTHETWVAASPHRFTCKSGDEKVEHVFKIFVNVQYVRIHVQLGHCGIALRAGVLVKPSESRDGTIVLCKSDKCLVAFAQETKWCSADALVDVRAGELDSALQTRFTSEVAQLKQLYHQGGAPAKDKHVYAESIECVRQALHDKLTAWDKEVEKNKANDDGAGHKVRALFRQHQDWLQMVFGSRGCEYMTDFWDLDIEKPGGTVSLVGSHQWEVLQRYVTCAVEAIETRKKESTMGMTRAVQWEFVEETSQHHEIRVAKIVWEEVQDESVVLTEYGAVATGSDEKKGPGPVTREGQLCLYARFL